MPRAVTINVVTPPPQPVVVAVADGPKGDKGDPGFYAFEINGSGDLLMHSNLTTTPDLALSPEGDLILTL